MIESLLFQPVGLGGVDYFAIFRVVGRWFIIFVEALAILAGMVALYLYTTFNYGMIVFPLFGSSKEGSYSIGKPRTNRIKKDKNGTVWKKLFPLGNKVELEPFDSEFIYPGRRIIAFEVDGVLHPGRVNIEKKDNDPNKLFGEIKPVPAYIRNWQSLQHKKNALEFHEPNFWEANKHFIIGLMSVLFCCILCGVTIYFTYKYAGPSRQDMSMLTNAIRGLSQIG